MRLLLSSTVSCALMSAAPVPADDLLPASRPVEEAVDHYIDAGNRQDGVPPAPQTDDATLVRRLTLDLVGRIPTAAEAADYVRSTDPDKRVNLTDRLLAAPGFSRHQAAMFDAMLATAGAPDRKAGAGVGDYLRSALRAGKSWDQVFRDLLLPDDAEPGQKGAADYLLSRVKDPDRLTNDVSVAFFGVNVSCAQCHDHPLVADWTQEHFYGMKGFLARTFDANGLVAERGAGAVRFAPAKGPERAARLMFLTGAAVETDTLREPTKDEARAEKEAMAKAKADKVRPPAPPFSARGKLVELALGPAGGDYFARNIANRVWHRFLGTGLVSPLDQMHSENPPSHPELLDWLARDTSAHGYDLRRLTRGIVLSRAYSRSSRFDGPAPPPKSFAVARVKPLTPLQLATSLKLASIDQTEFDGLTPAEFEQRLEAMEVASRQLTAGLGAPSDDAQIGVGEALLFSNGEKIAREVLADGPGTLLARVRSTPDPRTAIDLMVRAVYSRPPTAEEVIVLSEYVGRRADRQAGAYQQLLWALLTASEFRFRP
jgi:hypothetical protein